MTSPDKPVSSSTKPSSAGAGAKIVDVRLVQRSGRYRIGGATRPAIHHDEGFLGQFPSEQPTVKDRAELAMWRARLEGAEALRPDLADATAAYRHFLDGGGKDRTLSYERYVQNDASGAKTLESLMGDFEYHAEIIGHNRDTFSVTSESYAVGADPVFFPYPATENWQKAIGAHIVWVSADVHVTTDPRDLKDLFQAGVIIHFEDRYNFNPGANDIVTGIPDSANGRFEITGLAHQYTNYATLSRNVTWKEGEGINATVSSSGTDRDSTRRPDDNRRLRNRI